MALESRPRARAHDGVERLSVRVALYGSAVHDQLHRRGVGRVARDVERARRAYRSEAGELRLRPILQIGDAERAAEVFVAGGVHLDEGGLRGGFFAFHSPT